jgi:hypothetical protein
MPVISPLLFRMPALITTCGSMPAESPQGKQDRLQGELKVFPGQFGPQFHERYREVDQVGSNEQEHHLPHEPRDQERGMQGNSRSRGPQDGAGPTECPTPCPDQLSPPHRFHGGGGDDRRICWSEQVSCHAASMRSQSQELPRLSIGFAQFADGQARGSGDERTEVCGWWYQGGGGRTSLRSGLSRNGVPFPKLLHTNYFWGR